MTAEHRSRAARVAIYTRLATADRKEMTAPARAAAMDRFEKQVDPNGLLDPAERAQRAEYAKKAYFTAISAKGVAARRANARRKRGNAA